MNAADVLTRRLFGQRVAGTLFQRPEDVVGWLGCVQSQEAIGARWSVGQRVANCTDADVAAALDEGRFLRTHILRPTWHYVLPEDIGWILQATAPRVQALNAYAYRKEELDGVLFRRCHERFITALQGGKHLTRTELGDILAEAGIVATSIRLAHIIMQAELDGLICSGAVRDKQHTYALLAERAPGATRFDDDDEALARLTLRYFSGHGPATVRDLAWWASLPLSTVRRGLEMAAVDLLHADIDGQTYWFSADAQPVQAQPLTAYLLPEFDELIWYRSLGFPEMGGETQADWNETFFRPILIGGRRAGVWKRTIARRAIRLEVHLFAHLDANEQAALDAAVQRYSSFMELPVTVSAV